MDIIERLLRWQSLRLGDPFPDALGGWNKWGDTLHADLADAIREIERLRSIAGAVTAGRTFVDITRQMRHASSDACGND